MNILSLWELQVKHPCWILMWVLFSQTVVCLFMCIMYVHTSTHIHIHVCVLWMCVLIEAECTLKVKLGPVNNRQDSLSTSRPPKQYLSITGLTDTVTGMTKLSAEECVVSLRFAMVPRTGERESEIGGGGERERDRQRMTSTTHNSPQRWKHWCSWNAETLHRGWRGSGPWISHSPPCISPTG